MFKHKCWKPQAKKPVIQEHHPTHQEKEKKERNEMRKKYVTDREAR